MSSTEQTVLRRGQTANLAAAADTPWNGPDWSGHEPLIGSADSAEEDDPDSDEEAERILAAFRRRQATAAEERAAVDRAVAEAEAISVPVQPHWGPAAKATALRNAMTRVQAAKTHTLLSLRGGLLTLQHDGGGPTSHDLLSDPDWVWMFHTYRAAALLGELPTEAALHAFASCASVCRGWHAAIAEVSLERVVLRHAHTCVVAPVAAARAKFTRPSFVELTPSGELLVAEHHRLAVLPSPSPSVAGGSGGAALAAGTSDGAGTLSGSPARRSLGSDDGSGGSDPGQLYHPHGIALPADGRSVFVADRSNHRVQRLGLYDGECLDCTSVGQCSAPNGLALHLNELFVADANHERVLVLNASDLRISVRSPFGSKGSAPGQLDRPRGLAILRHPKPDAAHPVQIEVVVAELGNHRCSVFSTSGEFRRTFGDVPTPCGAMPLRQPYGVLAANGVLLVSEFHGRRLCVFGADAEHAPLQVLASPGP